MLYSTATTCAMRNPKVGSGILTKILSCHGHMVPNSASYWSIYYPFAMYCVLYDHATKYSISEKKHIIAIKTIHLSPFQQKLHRPRFLLGHDTEEAIMVLNILIISKIIF